MITHNLFRRTVCALLLSTLNPQPSTTFAQGALTPPGAPAPTMKSLAQVEPRTPISFVPYTISAPGSYYLTANLSVSNGDAITIATNGVTLDLNGFTISSTATSATGTGILLGGGLRNIAVANGFIQGGVTNNGSGVYTGSGFSSGIFYSGGVPMSVLVSRVTVSGCLYYGIYLNFGDTMVESLVVESCSVRTVGSYGIWASTVKSCYALDCGADAIIGLQASNSRGQCSGSGTGLVGSSAQDCVGQSTGGIGLAATTAQNCYGYSSTERGLDSVTALNCYGHSDSNYGLFAIQSAQNCYGESTNGTGLYATIAQNCHGESGGSGDGLHAVESATGCSGHSETGGGLYASSAQNCYGISNGDGAGVGAETASNCRGFSNTNRGVSANVAISCSGYAAGSSFGVYATSIANTCDGISQSGTGLHAYIAIGCTGNSLNYSFHYNMPP